MRGFPIFGALVVAAISVFASPIQSGEVVQSAVGNVVDAQGKVYELQNTGTPNIRVITDKINGEFVRPVSFNVASMYTCKFYRYFLLLLTAFGSLTVWAASQPEVLALLSASTRDLTAASLAPIGLPSTSAGPRPCQRLRLPGMK
jgi:hypothetical protein